MIAVNKLLSECINRNASDLHITPGKPPILRLNGGLVPLEMPALSTEDIEQISNQITDE